MRPFLLLSVVVLSAVSCENFYEDTDEYTEAVGMVEWFRVDTVANLTATVTFRCFTPTPCWSFSRMTEQRDSTDILMTVYSKVKKNVTCIQVVGNYTQTVSVTVPAPGRYTLKMYQNPTTTKDTTILF